MKKKLLSYLLLTFFGFLTVNAQITMTSSDAPFIGMVSYTAHDSLPSRVNSILPGNSGVNQVWDFTTLTLLYNDTMNFVVPSSTPYSAKFPSANIAVRTRQLNMPYYLYLKNDGSGVYAMGVVGNVSASLNSIVTVDIVPQFSMLRVPANYLSNYSENYSTRVKAKSPSSLSSFSDSINQHSWVVATSEIDGWGSLTTPTGTYNVLRQKLTEVNTDTTWIHAGVFPPYSWQQFAVNKDTTLTYRWWTNGLGMPVMQMVRDAHTHAKTKNVQWDMSVPNNLSDLVKDHSIKVYPNPANDKIVLCNLNNKFSGIIEISDLIGKVIKRIDATGFSEIEIKLNDMNSGIYFVSVVQEGIKLQTEKIIISH